MGIFDENPVEGQYTFTDCPCLVVTTLLMKEIGIEISIGLRRKGMEREEQWRSMKRSNEYHKYETPLTIMANLFGGLEPPQVVHSGLN